MLKKRIRKWELDRNHKHADMLYAVQVALNRESQGKKTVFLIRGRVITFDEVQHYFRRRGVRDLRSLLKTADAAVPTTRIECHTPEPTKIVTADDHTHLKATAIPAQTPATQLHDASSAITVMPYPNQIATVLPQPEDLHKLDQLLRYGRDYYSSLFEGPDWRVRQKALELSPLENFYHSLAEGHVFLDAGQVTVAFKRFDYAFELVKGILDDGPLLLLPYLYHLFLPGRGIGQQDVLLKVLEFISEMIHTRFPHLRPVQESLALLCRISCKQRRHYSIRIFQSILDQLRSVFRDDAPSELQLQQATELLCTPTHTDNFNMTSRAIWKLSKDAELLETQIASPPGFRTPLHNYSSTSAPKCPYWSRLCRNTNIVDLVPVHCLTSSTTRTDESVISRKDIPREEYSHIFQKACHKKDQGSRNMLHTERENFDSEADMQRYSRHEQGFQLERLPKIWDLDINPLFPSNDPSLTGDMESSSENSNLDYLGQPKLKSHCARFKVSDNNALEKRLEIKCSESYF
jgi:hypothetical protein